MGRERLIMTITVGLLAAAIFTVFWAYYSFGDKSDENESNSITREYGEYTDADSLRMVAVVSETKLNPSVYDLIAFSCRSFGTVSVYQQNCIPMIHIKTTAGPEGLAH